MRKRKLYLPHGCDKHQGWNWTLNRMLINSKLFDVEFKKFPWTRVNGARNRNWTMMELDGVTIGLDTWDTWSPTSNFYESGFFEKELKHVDLILKIQYYDCKFWDKFQNDTKIKVKPWTVMPTKDFPLGSFKWENKKHKWIGTVTGKNNRFGRQPWSEWCEKQTDFYSSGSYLVNDTMEDYINRLKECKWGIILKGKNKNHDGKNRRECEFSSCGMPLALTYKPTYCFDMIPDHHYVLLNKPDDLEKLRYLDPEPYALAASQLYYDHFSAYGASKTLISIVESL